MAPKELLTPLLVADDILESSPGLEQAAVLDLTVELADCAVLWPVEINASLDVAVGIDEFPLEQRHRQTKLGEQHPRPGFSGAFGQAVTEIEGAPETVIVGS